MKKYLALIAFLLVSCQSAPVTEITVDTIIMKSDFTPPLGPKIGWGNDGPYEHRLVSAWSENGVEWDRTEQVITEQANVPDMILNDEGQIMLYYTGGNILGQDQAMAVAISDDGNQWLFKEVMINGEPEGTSRGGDPDIVRLEDGSYRLYYTAQLMGQNSPGILYADSSDGIEFDYQGQSLYLDGEMIMDSTTFSLDGQWIMITLNGDGTELVHAVSDDGREFEFVKQEEVSFAGRPMFLSNHIETEDGAVMYGFDLNEGISSFFSSTGLEWTESGHSDLQVDGSSELESEYLKDPAILRMEDGSYFMVYVTRFPTEEINESIEYNPSYPLMNNVVCPDEECLECSNNLFWSHPNTEIERLAVAVVNWDYPETTRVFVLDLAPVTSELMNKTQHDLKVRFGCHAGGCNIYDGYLTWDGREGLIYQTWTGEDPYDESGIEWVNYSL